MLPGPAPPQPLNHPTAHRTFFDDRDRTQQPMKGLLMPNTYVPIDYPAVLGALQDDLDELRGQVSAQGQTIATLSARLEALEAAR